MSVGVMKRWWDKRVLTCRSCLAASAPARVWNVTKPTGCKGKEQKHILSLRRSCGWKVSNYFMPIMVAVGLLLTRAAGCCCSHKPSSSSASIRRLQWRCSSTGKVHLKVGKVEAHTTTSGTVEGPLLCDIENTYRCGFAIFAGHLQQRSLVTLFELRRIIGKLNQITGYWYGKFDVCQFLTSNRLITIRLGITPSTACYTFWCTFTSSLSVEPCSFACCFILLPHKLWTANTAPSASHPSADRWRRGFAPEKGTCR